MTPGDSLERHPLATAFGRLRPEQVLEVFEEGDFRATGRVMALNSYENRVFRVELEDDAGQTVWRVGKFYRPGRWSVAALAEEHGFIAELVEAGLPVVAPRALPVSARAPGGPVTVGALHGETEGVFYALYDAAAGRPPQELDDAQLRTLGRLVAQLHSVGAERDAPSRPRLDVETYALGNLAYLVEHEVIPVEARAGYVSTVEHLAASIGPMLRAAPVHRVHGDLHMGNLLWGESGPLFLDLDDFCVGPAAQDVWLLAPSSDADGVRQREVLLSGYHELRDFDPAWLSLVEPLRALRFVHYSAWIARRWHDPIFPRTFPHFGTLRYWQQEMNDLREQIARIEYP